MAKTEESELIDQQESDSVIILKDRIKQLQKQNNNLAEFIGRVLRKDGIITKDDKPNMEIEKAGSAEIIFYNDNDFLIPRHRIAMIPNPRKDNIIVEHYNYGKDTKKLILFNQKINKIGYEQYWRYIEDPYKTIYYGIVLTNQKLSDGKYPMAFTEVYPEMLKWKKGSALSIQNLTGGMGQYHPKVVNKRIQKYRNRIKELEEEKD